MPNNDGGPVFPSPAASVGHEVGMSLRDWFAGMALQYLQPGYDKGQRSPPMPTISQTPCLKHEKHKRSKLCPTSTFGIASPNRQRPR